jgi:hypothetical protein
LNQIQATEVKDMQDLIHGPVLNVSFLAAERRPHVELCPGFADYLNTHAGILHEALDRWLGKLVDAELTGEGEESSRWVVSCHSRRSQAQKRLEIDGLKKTMLWLSQIREGFIQYSSSLLFVRASACFVIC